MKNNKKIAPICIALACIVFCIIIYFIISKTYEELNNAKLRSIDAKQSLERLQLEDAQIAKQQEKDELELRSIKPIFQAPENTDDQNLAAFGQMFEKIISVAKSSGLLLRSIEYNMNPPEDAVYKDFGNLYNVCDINFFFVGTYMQLKSFLMAITNNFEYLVSISNLNVSSYSQNPDYILINLSLTLYSKKPVKEAK